MLSLEHFEKQRSVPVSGTKTINVALTYFHRMSDQAKLTKKSAQNTAGVLFLLIVSAPYLKPFGVGTDSDIQPYPLLLSLLVIMVNALKAKKISKTFSLSIFYIILFTILHVAAFGLDAYYLTRGLYGYISILTITLSVLIVLKKIGVSSAEKTIKLVYCIWVGIGLVQLVDNRMFTFWRDKLIITNGRGSLSLATEPAYFCIAIILLAVCLYILNAKNHKYLICALLVSLFVAKSSVGVIYSGAVVAFFLLQKPQKAVFFGFLLLAVTLLFAQSLSDARISSVFINFIRNPIGLAALDQSYGLRVTNLVIPAMAFFDNYGMPHGFYQWTFVHYEYLVKYFSDSSWVFLMERPDNLGSGRILSIHGQLLFELGAFSVFVYLYLWRVVRNHEKGARLFSLIMILFMNGLTFNNPFFSILLAVVIFQSKASKKRIHE